MADFFELKSNLPEFKKKFEDMEKEFTQKQLLTILDQAVSTLIVPAAKERIKLLTGNYTQELKDYLGTRTGPRSLGKWLQSGTLAKSVRTTPSSKFGAVVVKVGTDFRYGEYFEYGTGLYGPKKGYIHPKSKPVMAWQDRTGKWFYAKKTSGMPPRPWLRPTVVMGLSSVGQFMIKRMTSLLQQRMSGK